MNTHTHKKNSHLISECHKVVCHNQVLEDDHPAGVFQSFKNEVAQRCHGAVRVVCEVYQVYGCVECGIMGS